MTEPRPKVYLHIGEPKTGTTFLQQVMWRNRSELAVSGVMLPGPRPVAHWRATQDLCDVVQMPNDPAEPFRGAWDRLARQALRAPRVAVISHELFAAASAEQAARAVRSLDRAEVHIVLTVRDFGTLLPAEWQESVKHRNASTWEDWLGDVIDHEANSPDRRRWWFWRVHDTLEILRLWSQHVPLDRVHVITMPPRGLPPGLLWERFAGLIGVDPVTVDTSRAGTNASLGLAEIELLRRVNQALPEKVPDWVYMHNIKGPLAHDALARRLISGRLEIPAERDEWAVKQAHTVAAELHESGYHIVGDLDELIPRTVTGPRSRPSDVTPEQMLEVSVEAITALLTTMAEDTPGTEGGAPGPGRTAGRVKRALIAASERSPAVHRVRRAYWHALNTLRRLRSASLDARTRP